MTRKIKFEVGEKYHIFNRGVEKIKTFKDERDYNRFLKLSYLCNSKNKLNFKYNQLSDFRKEIIVNKKENIVDIEIEILMPNHYHFIICEIFPGFISIFMQKLMTSYTMYFNKRYDRSGGLFSSPFKAVHISNDFYYEYLKKYLYCNPLSLIRKNYDSKFLLDPNFKLTKKEENFLNKYPYSVFKPEARPCKAWPRL